MDDSDLKLMIPGPVPVEDEVLSAMGSPVRAHYGPGWTKLYNETTATLKTVFGTQGDVFIMVGTGSAGIEACLGSAFSSGEKILIGINGFFGERMKSIAENLNLNAVVVPGEWGKPFIPEHFEEAIRQNPDATGIGAVHLETSTTIINPIAEIGQIARKHGLYFFVDSVSSLGGLQMKMDEWGIDLCASASQKCLGAPPGLSPIAVNKHGWEAIDRNPSKGHGWYLNLCTWRQYATDWGSWHPFPITMATNNVLALRSSLASLMAEGIDRRIERYRCLALQLRKGLRQIGMEPFTPDELMAPMITAALGPAGVPTSKIVSYISDVHRIKIAGGLGILADKIIRIGHMSPTVTEWDIDRVLKALSQFKS